MFAMKRLFVSMDVIDAVDKMKKDIFAPTFKGDRIACFGILLQEARACAEKHGFILSMEGYLHEQEAELREMKERRKKSLDSLFAALAKH